MGIGIIFTKIASLMGSLVNGLSRLFKAIVAYPLPSALIFVVLLWAGTGYYTYRMYSNWQDAQNDIQEKQEEIDQLEQEIEDAIQDAQDQEEEDGYTDPFPDLPDFDFDPEEPTDTPTTDGYDEVVKEYESEIDEEEEDETIDNRGAPDTAEHRDGLVSRFGDNLRESLRERADG